MNEITNINNSLPAQLIHLGKRIAQVMDDRLDTVGLSTAKLAALDSIVTSREVEALVTVTCMADVMQTTKSNVTSMVDRLIAEGLVTRQQSAEDRRSVVIALTALGEERYQQGVALVQEFHAELSAMLSAEEKQHLGCLLEKLVS